MNRKKMGDSISRKETLKSIEKIRCSMQMMDDTHRADLIMRGIHLCEEAVMYQPSAQPEAKPISYADCANATMMMWIDKVLTDGEYKKIMDKLNAHEMKKRRGEEDE